MPARPASSGEVSPPSVAPATQVTSSGFSSAPVAPVMASTHSRRRKGDAGWLKSNTADAQNQNGNEGSSPSSSGTQDEDIRSKSRPGSAGSQDSSSSKKEDAAPMDANRQKAVNATQFSSLSSGSAALLQLREHARNASPSAVNRSNGGTQSAGSGSGANRAVENVQKKLPPQTAMNAGVGPNQLNAFHGSRSASHEQEQNPMIPQDEEMNGDDDVDDLDDDPNTPPSPSERDVRIMFHGREIYAEDLIGLRVAKTFAGLGRFLGQVVKFDHRAALYTVVYADGDAEDLSIDGTLHILIQDEIERADPAQVPPAISLLFKKGEEPASPDSGDFMMQQPATQQHRAPQQRPRIQVSDREAQFVISLFENHALPSLVRQGWRVQTSTSGSGETRFVSPVREIFTSSLDVVGYIASNEELLASCFPANIPLVLVVTVVVTAEHGNVRPQMHRVWNSSTASERAKCGKKPMEKLHFQRVVV
ncbi:hypothetical protein PHYBOEH_002002 [Phytophthora boehmeriae]|uniref:PTM/DIR17-like Tudor domain-containing protein n=1 Tax=Phytophthora boehmeriae TaxID=109152 RepID=A0A8T1WWM3_9STRA|nr:hypothetical protein PHYBOEH_002002 [Phytophthora boehmeriae]